MENIGTWNCNSHVVCRDPELQLWSTVPLCPAALVVSGVPDWMEEVQGDAITMFSGCNRGCICACLQSMRAPDKGCDDPASQLQLRISAHSMTVTIWCAYLIHVLVSIAFLIKSLVPLLDLDWRCFSLSIYAESLPLSSGCLIRVWQTDFSSLWVQPRTNGPSHSIRTSPCPFL